MPDPTDTTDARAERETGEVRLDQALADALAAQLDRIKAEADAASDADETGEPRRFVAVTQDGIRPLDEADRADLRHPEPPGCPGCAFCAPQEAAQTLVEDEDGAPYPGHVQDALDRIANALAGALPDVSDRDVAEVAQRAANAAAPLLLDLLPDPEAEPTTDYALALMRSTLLDTQHPDETAAGERGLFTYAEAVAVTDALRPQVTRMLADADARVERARDAALAEAYAGADDDPGHPEVTPTDAQWLRRLFDLPADQRLACASYLLAAGQEARRCFEGNHVRRLTALENELYRLNRVRTVLTTAAARTNGPEVAALLDAALTAVNGPSPIDSTPIQCPERHPDTGNPCTVAGPHGDAEHRAMGRERMQLFGSALTCAEAPAAPLLCPECAQGKTRNCAGQALDPATDDLVPCATQAQGADQ